MPTTTSSGSAADLGDALRELALALCSASLDIEKQSVGGTATFDYTVNGSGLAPLHPQHRGRQPHDQRPLRVHRPPVRGQVRPGVARARLDAHEHRVHRQRRRHHHRHRHRRLASPRAPPPASIRATPPCGRTSVTMTPRPARYTNTLLSATITVTKDAVPDAAQDFGYTTTGTGGGTFAERLQPRRRRRRHAPDQPHLHLHRRRRDRHQDDQETPASAGWTLTNIVCTANGADITIGTGSGAGFAQAPPPASTPATPPSARSSRR